MIDSILSMLPPGLFGNNKPVESLQAVSMSTLAPVVAEEVSRKRVRNAENVRGCGTPSLISRRGSEVPSFREEDDVRPLKKFRGPSGILLQQPDWAESPKLAKKSPKSSLAALPEDVLAHCLGFLNSAADRFALQCTCKQFRKISNSEEMLIGIQVGGDCNTGLHGIILDNDTPDTAADKLMPFVLAGNLEAIYILGIIQSYCQVDIHDGVCMLKMASAQGYVRASYALGLVLRDSHADEAAQYMKMAANAGYLPALQELLPAREMKAKYGEPNADELRRHLDHLCLNRLLARHYVRSPDLRNLNTSHCWNPLCGRWAFKATVTQNGVSEREGTQQDLPLHLSRSRMHRHQALMQQSSNEHTVDEVLSPDGEFRVSRMKMCSRCCRAKYCSKLCQVYDWRSGRHKMECQFL